MLDYAQMPPKSPPGFLIEENSASEIPERLMLYPIVNNLAA
jgi:hypothetical protein